jgi:hypothetical protein
MDTDPDLEQGLVAPRKKMCCSKYAQVETRRALYCIFGFTCGIIFLVAMGFMVYLCYYMLANNY